MPCFSLSASPGGPRTVPTRRLLQAELRGVHDIHMNQGNPLAGGHAGDNGVWQDGGLLLWFPKADRWVTVFLAFQSQSWHTDDHTGNPIEGRTGAEAARFDAQNRPLIAAEQRHPAIEIIAARVQELAHEPPALLLLNMGGDDVDLSGWSLMAARDATKSLTGTLTGGETLAVEVPARFFEDRGGVVSLLDAAGLKVDGTTHPAGGASPARLDQARLIGTPEPICVQGAEIAPHVAQTVALIPPACRQGGIKQTEL